MIGLALPYPGKYKDAEVIASVRGGASLDEIKRKHGYDPEQAMHAYLDYIDHVVTQLDDLATAKQQRAIVRDCVLELISRYYTAACELNLKAAQFVLGAIAQYAKLERDHYTLDREQMLHKGQEAPDDDKALSPREASARRQARLDELEKAGHRVPSEARRAGSLIMDYED